MSSPTVSPTPVVLGGTFISQDSPPAFRVQANHPIAKFLRGNADIKKMQLLHSNKVEGIIFVSNNKISTLYLGHLAYDDPAEEIPVVAGALGSLCHNSFPVAISMQDLLAETLIALPRTFPVTSSFVYGKPLSDAFFCTDDDNSKPLSRADDSQEFSLISFPLCLPKLRGQPIVEGSLHDDNVIASLHNYHPDAGDWVDMHLALLQTPTAIVSKEPFASIDPTFLPQSRPSVPATTAHQISLRPLFDSGEDSTSLRFRVQELIDHHKQTNKDRFFAHHPSLAPTLNRQTHDQTSPSRASHNIAQPPKLSTNDTFDVRGISIHKKYQRALNTYKVVMASVTEETILCPPLRKEFLLAYSQASSQENSRYATTALKEHDLERAEHTRDYLQRLVSGLHWNHATTSLFLHAMFHTSPLDEQKEILKTSISFLTFLAPPSEQSSPELKEYLQNSYVEHMQAVVGESNEKKQKLSIKTFQGGLQNSPHDVLVGLANLESRLSFLVDYSQPDTPKPLFVQWILQLAHIFSSPEFNNFHKKYAATHKWIAHAMVTQIQMVFAMITKVATSLKVLNTIQNKLPLPLDTFALPIKAFSNLISDLHSIISGVGAGVYSTPPLSYVPPPTPIRTLRNHLPSSSTPRRGSVNASPQSAPHSASTYKGSPSDKGWIVAKQRLLWPKDLSGTQLCARFALIGSSCPHGYACPYDHKFFPRDFNIDDQKILCKFVSDNHPGLSFAPGVRVPSFDTTNKPHTDQPRHHSPSILRPRPRPLGSKRPSSPHPEAIAAASPPPKKKVSLTQSS